MPNKIAVVYKLKLCYFCRRPVADRKIPVVTPEGKTVVKHICWQCTEKSRLPSK
jgi:hypothetical protein